MPMELAGFSLAEADLLLDAASERDLPGPNGPAAPIPPLPAAAVMDIRPELVGKDDGGDCGPRSVMAHFRLRAR